ncbi:hypothetical protein CBR_g28485 [Chara braunii]|uniref:Transmembrane protein n=1 Tax=Chara braunii TaxID=69332 RepID=A0A388JW14_CHABU|nr:hypothetical protein CBR_g28485 [Chara braunii]|eukprot:GBG62009.1 hypothetical protein CBR_g28485 [Chara braunii]
MECPSPFVVQGADFGTRRDDARLLINNLDCFWRSPVSTAYSVRPDSLGTNEDKEEWIIAPCLLVEKAGPATSRMRSKGVCVPPKRLLLFNAKGPIDGVFAQNWRPETPMTHHGVFGGTHETRSQFFAESPLLSGMGDSLRSLKEDADDEPGPEVISRAKKGPEIRSRAHRYFPEESTRSVFAEPRETGSCASASSVIYWDMNDETVEDREEEGDELSVSSARDLSGDAGSTRPKTSDQERRHPSKRTVSDDSHATCSTNTTSKGTPDSDSIIGHRGIGDQRGTERPGRRGEGARWCDSRLTEDFAMWPELTQQLQELAKSLPDGDYPPWRQAEMSGGERGGDDSAGHGDASQVQLRQHHEEEGIEQSTVCHEEGAFIDDETGSYAAWKSSEHARGFMGRDCKGSCSRGLPDVEAGRKYSWTNNRLPVRVADGAGSSKLTREEENVSQSSEWDGEEEEDMCVRGVNPELLRRELEWLVQKQRREEHKVDAYGSDGSESEHHRRKKSGIWDLSLSGFWSCAGGTSSAAEESNTSEEGGSRQGTGEETIFCERTGPAPREGGPYWLLGSGENGTVMQTNKKFESAKGKTPEKDQDIRLAARIENNNKRNSTPEKDQDIRLAARIENNNKRNSLWRIDRTKGHGRGGVRKLIVGLMSAAAAGGAINYLYRKRWQRQRIH